MTKYLPLLLSALWVTATFPGNVFTALMIDRLGRRTFMLIGLAGCLVSNIFEAALQAEYLVSSNKAGQRAAVFFIFLFAIFWSSFLDASQYLYISEIFPTHIRAEGMALGMSGVYLADIVLLVAGPIALDKIKVRKPTMNTLHFDFQTPHALRSICIRVCVNAKSKQWKFFLVFIIPTTVLWLCVFFFFPETKQRSLEDINAAFGDKVAVHYYNATTEEEEEYLKVIAVGDLLHRNAAPGLVSTKEEEAGGLHAENV